MIKSMTGFGRGEDSDGVRTATVEIRSVNHRYGELSVKLPGRYRFAEDAVKKIAQSEIKRGKTDISVNVTSGAEEEAAVSVNTAAAKQYFKGLRELQQTFDVCGEITLALLAGLPDVLKTASPALDETVIARTIVGAASNALRELDGMRVAEGRQLAADLMERADVIEALLGSIDARAPELPAVYAKKLKDRIEALIGFGGPELTATAEERLALEVAVFADRSNITEEIVRLKSHLGQLRAILTNGAGEPVGKKLDFLVQEMNREANTIGSKANDLKITSHVLDMKSEIEKVREQVQNIE
jgi:uncharacterized protein (TIGR00255 family)